MVLYKQNEENGKIISNLQVANQALLNTDAQKEIQRLNAQLTSLQSNFELQKGITVENQTDYSIGNNHHLEKNKQYNATFKELKNINLENRNDNLKFIYNDNELTSQENPSFQYKTVEDELRTYNFDHRLIKFLKKVENQINNNLGENFFN